MPSLPDLGHVSAQALATGLILLSAFLHALVNMLTKTSEDGLITRGCMNAVALALSAGFLVAVPFPQPELWLLLLVSVLIHALYPFFLVEAYRGADLSAAYPIARGTAPLFVVLFLGIAIESDYTLQRLAGIGLICIAVGSLALDPLRVARESRRTKSIAAALATGLIVAAYTVVDAAGLRIAPTPFAYIVWLFVLDGAVVATATAVARRRTLAAFLARHWKMQLVAGLLGTLTYGLALLALSLGPVAEIAALRETSILFAAFIGSRLLGEPFGARRTAAAAMAFVGIVVLQLSASS